MSLLLQVAPFLVIDLALFLFAWRKPWLGLVALLAGLPFNGVLTRVVPDLLALSDAAAAAMATWHDALLGGFVAAAGLAWLRSRDRRLGLVEWLVLLVLGLGLVFVVVSPYLVTALYAYRVLYEPPLLLAAVLVLSRTSGIPLRVPRLVALAVVVPAVVAALFTWWQVYVGKYTYLQRFYAEPGERLNVSFTASGIRQPRAVGTFTSPNEFGAYLALAIGLLLLPGVLRLRPAVRAWALAALALALLLTFSRSGWLATAVVITVVAVLSAREALPGLRDLGQRLRTRSTLLAVGPPLIATLALSAAVVATSGAPQYVERTAQGSEPSARGRTASVVRGLGVLRSRPLGLGLGTAGPKSARLGETRGPRIRSEMWYVVYAIQVGVIGFAAFAALLAAIAWRLLQARALPWSRVAFAIGAGLGTGALFIPIIEDPPIFTPLWAIAGLALALAAAREVVPDRPRLSVGAVRTA